MALRDINLVPETVLNRRYLVRHGVGWVAAYALVAVSVLCLYSYQLCSMNTSQKTELTEAMIYRRIATTIAEIEQKTDSLESVAAVHRLSSPVGAADMVSHLAAAMGPKAWLTSMQIQTDDKRGTEITMAGLAHSNTELGALIQELSSDGMFSDVAMSNSAKVRAPVDAKRLPPFLVRFNIRANIPEG